MKIISPSDARTIVSLAQRHITDAFLSNPRLIPDTTYNKNHQGHGGRRRYGDAMISDQSQQNFNTLRRAFSRGDVSVVACKDSKGKEYQVLCTLSHDPEMGYTYTPFALMITPSFYPLINKIQPPESLHGDWDWRDDT